MKNHNCIFDDYGLCFECDKVKKQAALRQAALTKRRKDQGLTRLQVWVTDEQKQKVLAMLKGA